MLAFGRTLIYVVEIEIEIEIAGPHQQATTSDQVEEQHVFADLHRVLPVASSIS